MKLNQIKTASWKLQPQHIIRRIFVGGRYIKLEALDTLESLNSLKRLIVTLNNKQQTCDKAWYWPDPRSGNHDMALCTVKPSYD
jgi:hypothetical protein